MSRNILKELMGTWITDPEDIESRQVYEKTRLEFTEDGRLTYTILGEEKDHQIFLTCRVEDGVLVTDQPSNPRQERTPFTFTPDGKLMLIYGDQKSTYIRAQ